MNRPPPRGYMGLIGLLITIAIIGFLFWRSDIFSPKATPAPEGTSDLVHGSTQVEQGTNAIQAAQNAKNLLENNNAQQQKDAGY